MVNVYSEREKKKKEKQKQNLNNYSIKQSDQHFHDFK